MLTLEKCHEIGKGLTERLQLRSMPIAMKLIGRDEIPEGCARPSESGTHYAMCQAFSEVRRNGRGFALFEEDHWCVWPIICYRNRHLDEADVKYLGGMQFIEGAEKSEAYFREHFPIIDQDKKKPGMALAPLSSCTFIPDMAIVYCIPGQLRQLLMSAKWSDAIVPPSNLQTVASCGAALIPVLNGETDYNVGIPDPGEFERALAWDDEMIFTVSAAKLSELDDSSAKISGAGFGFRQLVYDMNLEYPRAPFYNEMFAKWDLAVGDVWDGTR
jgi:uncharacterized protein (DUF169 family)